MKFIQSAFELDETDVRILELVQQDCKRPLAAIGEDVGLSAPSVVERIRKLEEAGIIRGYVALLDAKRLGKDVTAFIGVSSSYPRFVELFEGAVAGIEDVLECHHITGSHTFLIKVKTDNTGTLEDLIRRIRGIEGVTRTETMVVLSTTTERPRIPLTRGEGAIEPRPERRAKRPRRTP
jgi:Lrp/AsnC family leucine-responsive transcriptional regulator